MDTIIITHCRDIVLVGSTFYYREEGRLAVRGNNYYDPERMFYQSVTRARKQIMLLVVDILIS